MQREGHGLSGTKVEDPLSNLPIGSSINFEPIVFGGSDAGAIPDGVANWTFFDGALMTLLVGTSEGIKAMGTVVAVAPGLAITATHIIGDYVNDIVGGTAAVLCAAPSRHGLELWDVRKVNFTEADDIAFLSLERASAITEDWRLRTIPATTRTPQEGETLHVIGFRLATVHADGASFGLEGDLFAASGEVIAVHYPVRDKFLMPFPTIEIGCGALGGMSGGAVLDDQGHLIGVISTSLATEDGEGPTFASWLVGGLNREVQITWPPGLYSNPIHVVDIDERLLRLEGRERIHIIDSNSYNYEVWFGR